MGQITSFRITRAPQRTSDDRENALFVEETPKIKQWLDANNVARQMALEYLQDNDLLPPVQQFRTGDADTAALLLKVRWLDKLLLSKNNKLDWHGIEPDVVARFDGQLPQLVERASWIALRQELSNGLVAILLGRGDVTIAADMMRLLLIMGLIELVLRDGDLDAIAVFNALRWRKVVLPQRILRLPFITRSVLARPPGVSDLYIVREEWNRYELGEIAHIENVLKGELKRSLLEKTDEAETTLTSETMRTKTAQQDTQTTDRFELKEATQRDTSLALHADGKVDTSGVYGSTKVDAHIGATFDYSLEESTSRATTLARETVSRAVSSLEESVRQQQIQRTLTRTRTLDKHELNNTLSVDHTIGIYRWVEKIQTVQIFKYPHRMLYEMEVPEPGAFIRWLNSQPRTGPMRPIVPFTLNGAANGQTITANMITGLDPAPEGEINYLQLARRYDIQGLQTPPSDKAVFTAITNDAPDNVAAANKPPVYKTSTVTIPENYEGYSFTIYAVATNDVPEGPDQPTGWLEIVIGTDFPSLAANDMDPQQIWRFQGKNVFRNMKNMTFRTPVTGQVPIILATDDTSGMMANAQIFCRPTATAISEWRLKIYDLILGGYLALQRQQADASDRAAIQAGITISGTSATRNAEIVREEIKRGAIELLMGERFSGRPAVVVPGGEGAPRISFEQVRKTTREIQFVEQAFEWENLSFVLYPYYWAEESKWPELERISSPDANFDRFLRCGSARVIVPARPGFEAATEIYTTFGMPWTGGPAPAPNEDLYFSIADEIRAQQEAPADGEPGESWEVRLPTTLVYLAPIGSTVPLENANAELPKMAENEELDNGGQPDGEGDVVDG